MDTSVDHAVFLYFCRSNNSFPKSEKHDHSHPMDCWDHAGAEQNGTQGELFAFNGTKKKKEKHKLLKVTHDDIDKQQSECTVY